MKYTVDSVVSNIIENLPELAGEMLVRIDGFEDIRIYEEIAQGLTRSLANSGLSVSIKLTRNKWESFEKTRENTSYIQSMVTNGWVTGDESVTFLRNEHAKNILVLMGTEDEQDSDGLINFYSITPQTLEKWIGNNYCAVIYDALKLFDKSDQDIVDALFMDLFHFVPTDIVKLSNISDSWDGTYSNIDEFMRIFFSNLPQWGLPPIIENVPNVKRILSNRSVIRSEYFFISRAEYKKLTGVAYKKIREQLTNYDIQNERYSSKWGGWALQSIKSYDEFAQILMDFVRGDNVSSNKNILLGVDFSIVEDVLELNITRPNTVRVKTLKTTGEPLRAFSYALLIVLDAAEERFSHCNSPLKLGFDFIRANIITDAIDPEDNDIKETWHEICCATDGVIEYINRKEWLLGDEPIDITEKSNGFFSYSNAVININNGKIKAANTNKTINDIRFDIKLSSDKESVLFHFQWAFSVSSPWLYSFADLLDIDLNVVDNENLITLGVTKNINALLFSKSDEEFFDNYDEIDIDYSLNIAKAVNDKANEEDRPYVAQFSELGKSFVSFVKEMSQFGLFDVLNRNEDSSISRFISKYVEVGNFLLLRSLPENKRWILDAYIHAFNIEFNNDAIYREKDINACIVPAWHPAALQKIQDQKIFFLDGCAEWWKDHLISGGKAGDKAIETRIGELAEISKIQNALNVFPSSGMTMFGSINTFGDFSLYAKPELKNDSKLKDFIRKDAIFDDDFDRKELAQMNSNAYMFYSIMQDYLKAFPDSYKNLNLVFLNPSDLQPVVAAVYHYVSELKDIVKKINVCVKILVKPENKGGKNYLQYWMDEFFSDEIKVDVKTYLNVWNNENDLGKLLNGNNDIVFIVDFLKVNSFDFIIDKGDVQNNGISDCLYPIVYKPSPVSSTTVKRKIELSQPQFSAEFVHTQVTRFRTRMDIKPGDKYIAVKEVAIDDESMDLVDALHTKAYWVVCIDSGMDGALLRSDHYHKEKYPIIGFSTGKGVYGQYNVTVTTRKTMLDTLKKQLSDRLYHLFNWDADKLEQASEFCIKQAGQLDGISLLSAINQKDRNINEFMAYVLTARREEILGNTAALKTVIHLDSYKHWFQKDSTNSDSESRPDFLVLEALATEDSKLRLKATIIECKIATVNNSNDHKAKAYGQVVHGMKVLSELFNPSSKSVMRRYWYAQLYRALVFAQVTFSNDDKNFESLAAKLRTILGGNFEIEWKGEVLGYWIDLNSYIEKVEDTERTDIKIVNIPQLQIQKILLGTENVQYRKIDDDQIQDNEQEETINARKEELEKQVKDETSHKLKHNRIEAPVSVDINGEKNTVLDSNSMDKVEDKHPINTEKDLVSVCNTKDKCTSQVAADSRKEYELESTRVLIGKDKRNEEVYWEFGNEKLANRHLLITGTSGQGKTYSIQTMLYELSKANISSVIFDYTEGFRPDQMEKNFISRMGEKIQQRIVYIQGVPANPFKRQVIDIAGMSMPEKTSDVGTRIANIFTHVYGFGEQQSAAIYTATKNGLDKYGDAMDFTLFKKELDSIKNEISQAKTVISKMTPFLDTVNFTTDEGFSWSDILYQPDASVYIFQLTSFSRDMQVVITEMLLWDMWYYTKKCGNKDHPFVVVLDEAQNLSHKENSPSAQILTEGRKFGWSAWYATQSLQVLTDDEIVRLSQSAFKMYFKPTDEEVTKIAKQLDPTNSTKWISPLKNLKKGQCIVVGDRNNSVGELTPAAPEIVNVTSFEERK